MRRKRVGYRWLGWGLFLLGWAANAFAGTYVVTDRQDDGVSTAISGTLRWAVDQANNNPGDDAIVFNLSNSITVFGVLNINGTVTIDGRGTTIGAKDNLTNIFYLTGSSQNSQIRDLALINSDTAIYLVSSGNTVQGCVIGTNWENAAGVGNNYGVLSTGNDNVVGGTAAATGNVLSGNTVGGIMQSGGTGLQVLGNRIGTDRQGVNVLANTAGVILSLCSQCRIGGDASAGAGNLISGNQTGVVMRNQATGNTLCGNIIGLNAGQDDVLANTTGVLLLAVSGNWIGCPAADHGNVIAGNTTGIHAYDELGIRPQQNRILNNFIGLTPGGMRAANNIGMQLTNSDYNYIGGDKTSGRYEKNIISGNSNSGIYLTGNGNSICGNYIGVTPDGLAAMGNSTNGVFLNGIGNVVGGRNDGAVSLGNIISGQTSGSTSRGLRMDGGRGNTIVGNYFGLNAAGTGALGNRTGLYLNGASYNVIGSLDPDERNVFAGNLNHGLHSAMSSGEQIIGNYFSTNAAGTARLTNGQSDIYFNTTQYSQIDGNLGCHSAYSAIHLDFSDNNVVSNNRLNVFSNGAGTGAAMDTGISVDTDSQGNMIGLPSPDPGNLVVGANLGIRISGADSFSNALYGNTICAFSNSATGQGIVLDGGNNGKSAPAILIAATNYISGSAVAGDVVEIFLADRGAGYAGGSLQRLGSTTAAADGSWVFVPGGLTAGSYVCATATDPANNTSAFSSNRQVGATIQTPTPTYTPTVTPTPSAMPSVTPTATPTAVAGLTTATRTPNPLENMDLGSKGILAFPNPGTDEIRFLMHLDRAAVVTVKIYNLLGECVAEIACGLPSGQGQTVSWDCRNAAAGVYVARIFQDGRETAKLKLAVAH